MDTIFAQATSPGRAGVSVVRISGPGAFALAGRICALPDTPRTAAVRLLKDTDGTVLDQAIVIHFAAPASFTGEDVVELHLHGSVAVVKSVLAVLGQDESSRLAMPGEFTRRALENDKLDLAQIEGLADLIDAETEAQRKQALRVFSGAIGKRVEIWRERLIRALALLEATIDFADEDVPVDVTPEVKELLYIVIKDLEYEISGSLQAERIRDGFEVAIVGPPNAGKSTLLNRLAGRDAAITSEVAGTTRDVIEVRMDIGGLPVTILDTAGLRESDNHVEMIGIDRALERARQADLRVFLKSPGDDLPLEPSNDDIVVAPKIDLAPVESQGVSGTTGAGVTKLIENIQEKLERQTMNTGVATNLRHRQSMEHALSCLLAAVEKVMQGPNVYDMASEDMRSAVRSLEALVGRIDVENLLDEIFSSFCLGK